LTVKYRRRHFPPASYLFRKNIKKNINPIKNNLEGFTEKNSFIHIHGDIYLKSALFLKKRLIIPLFYASRNNDIDRDKIYRKLKFFSIKDYLFSLFYEQINKFREKQIAKKSDIITFLNQSERDAFINRTRCDVSKISIIPNSTSLLHFNPIFKNTNSSAGVSKILYVGGLSFNKGFWELLKVAALMKKKGYDALHFYALGRTENIKKTYDLINQMGIDDIVSIEGYKDPFPYYKDCDLFVYPTPYEAFGNIIIESLYTGCPVIASAVGGIPEILEYPKLLFTYGDTEALCTKIENLINSNDEYKKIRFLGSERIKHFDFNWEKRFEGEMSRYLENE
jgi:glycosyltransferase involved in cell wall biosynthesis